MYGRESIILIRDVNAIRIPEGINSVLPKGQIVSLFQSLGGNYTVTDERGYMMRIAGEDADALGKEPPSIANIQISESIEAIELNCWEVMRTVYDPEIPVNIVELGLIYLCNVTPIPEGGHSVKVIMTLTAPACGMGPVLQSDVEHGIKALPGVSKVDVEVVFDPPWSRDMMSEHAKLQLGML